MMHRFDPRTSQYRQIGEPDCYLGVRGMAVDARGTIYLGDNIGDLHSWQEGATTCTNTGFSGYASMIYDVAPAFVADAPGALDESLFAADSTTLAQLALPGFTIGRSFTLAGTGDVILGGTGDGRLFAFRRSTGSLARVDPSSGAQSDVRVIDSRFSSYIGFAVWRQEAWIFKLASSFDRSTIMRYPLTSGSGVSEGTTPGFTVVAAATATCGASL